MGEDRNLNGIRDQDADGNWLGTDFLANDSDVDGIIDSSEVWGRWCLKTETSAQCSGANNTQHQLWAAGPPVKNGALIADWDGDGLHDGQGKGNKS